MDIKKAKLRITMPDGSRWDVPISIIANDRANYYKNEFGDSLQRSLDEDTWPVFVGPTRNRRLGGEQHGLG